MARLADEQERGPSIPPPGADCEHCPLASRRPVLPFVNPAARLIVCGEAPGAQEEDQGEPFVGPSGNMLNRTCEALGINRQTDLHITNALLCRPPRKLSPAEWKQATICCRERLHRELASCSSTTVCAMGARALFSLCGKASIFPWLGAPRRGVALETQTVRSKKARHQGALVTFADFIILPALHPAFCLRSPGYIPVMQQHFGRAWALATGTLKPWVWAPTQIETGEDMVAALREIHFAAWENGVPVAVDVETQGIDPWRAPIMCIGLSNGAETVSVPWRGYASKRFGGVLGLADRACAGTIEVLVRTILESDPLVFQNGTYDMTALRADGFDIPAANWYFDTLPAHALTAPRLRHDLQLIACLEFPLPSWKAEFGQESDAKGGEKFSEVSEQALRTYNAHDAEATARLVPALWRRLADDTHNGLALMDRAMRLLRGPAWEMTKRGILVDKSQYGKHAANFAAKMDEARAEISTAASLAGMTTCNVQSQRDLNRLFFTQLRCAPTKYTDLGAPSLDEEGLQAQLVSQNPIARQAAAAVLKFRRWKKLNDYLGMPLDEEGALHVFWRPSFGARTGRWSSSPNLQNIPKPKRDAQTKAVLAPGLRDLFVARPGYVLVEADYKQLELRIAALLSGCRGLLDIFSSGGDVHRIVAASLFGRSSPGDVAKDERDLTKLWHYAAIYGAEVENIWKRMVVDFNNLALSTVIGMYDRWFKMFREVRIWQIQQVERAQRSGYVEVPLDGRRQYYLDGKIDANEVLNFPVQGTGAALIDGATLALHDDIDYKDIAILIQCHDALMLEVREERAEEACVLLKRHMERSVELNGAAAAFPVDFKMGPCWAYMAEPEKGESVEQTLARSRAAWEKARTGCSG